MAEQISTFLMFEGRAEEAMNFYVSLFEDVRRGRPRTRGVGDDRGVHAGGSAAHVQ